MYHTYGRGKSVIVERFNRTLKTIMWRRLTAENTHAWVAILPQLIAKYNKTKHSVLHMTPNYASKHEEQTAARWAMVRDANDEKLPNKKPRFAVGDVVRVSRTKGVFEKGYDVNWSRETFTVTAVNTNTKPTVYRIADSNHEEIKGSFYDEELQKVKHKDVFLVDKVLKEKGRGARKTLYVSWLGYPSSANSWIKASDATNV